MLPSDPSFERLAEEQLVWIYLNMRLDLDEKIDSICSECKPEINKKRCIVCGNEIRSDNTDKWNNNASFNEVKFKDLDKE